MPITFQVTAGQSFFVSTWSGVISDDEMLASYRQFYAGSEWVPGVDELADLTEVDFSAISTDGLRRVMEATAAHFESAGVDLARTGVVVPRDLPYGLARVYQAISDASPEEVRVFRSYESAVGWLSEPA